MKRMILITAMALLFLLLAGIALAADGYDLSWWTVDGGGGSSDGTGYSLSGGIGQPDAGVLTGTGYRLEGGFWSGPVWRNLYLPVALR